ncbi:hypothetical protein [Pseudonocardia lacus]|uniref:hypothetical protein n=1 Tax=Pseudonocardia lacus TaxID=2835865 RepID=UPI001BDCB508|nr:hypothetical protein [Pseudonocardia lacus]
MGDDRAVFEAIATAMAGSREPDLSPFDPEGVRAALGRVLRDPGARREFLTWLAARVAELSGGRVHVEERPVAGDPPSSGQQPELPVRLVVDGEPFAEPVTLRADDPVVLFPMRG